MILNCEARLTSLGTDLKGVTEKTELIILLEQPSSCISPDMPDLLLFQVEVY